MTITRAQRKRMERRKRQARLADKGRMKHWQGAPSTPDVQISARVGRLPLIESVRPEMSDEEIAVALYDF